MGQSGFMVKQRNLPPLLSFSAFWTAFYHTAGWETGVVICGKPAVTWFVASTNQRHSAFLIPHFTFRIPQFRILPIAVSTSNWSNFWHAFASRGFVIDSSAFLSDVHWLGSNTAVFFIIFINDLPEVCVVVTVTVRYMLMMESSLSTYNHTRIVPCYIMLIMCIDKLLEPQHWQLSNYYLWLAYWQFMLLFSAQTKN